VAPRDRPTRGHLYVKVKVARLLLGAPSLALIIVLLLSAAVVKEISYILSRLLLITHTKSPTARVSSVASLVPCVGITARLLEPWLLIITRENGKTKYKD
jgi:hypothetical protein